MNHPDSKHILNPIEDFINRSTIVVVLWKNETNWPVVFASHNVEQLCGYSTDEFINGKVQYIDMVHPDDLARATREVKDFLTTNADELVHEPYRLICKNGDVIWVSDQTYARRSEKGEVTHLEGALQDITQQLETEKNLAQQSALSQIKEAQYKVFANASFEALFISENGYCIEQNKAASEMFGYTDEEAIGMFATDIVAPEYKDMVINHVRNGYTKPYDAVVQRKNGETFNAEVHGADLVVDGKKLRITAIRDIENRKKTEFDLLQSQEDLKKSNASLQATTRYLTTISEFTQQLQLVSSIDNLAQSLVEVLMNKFYFEDCVVYLLADNKEDLVQVAANGTKLKSDYDNSAPLVLKIGEGIVGASAKAMKPINVTDTSKDSRYVVDDAKRFSELAVPIIFNGELLGVIDSEHILKNYFTQEHVNVLTTIANISASRLKNLISEVALKESELKHRLIFESAKDAILLMKDGVFVDCNSITLKMFGCSSEHEIIGKSPARFSPAKQYNGGNSSALAKEKIELAVLADPQTFDWLHCKLNGDTFDAEVSLNAFEFKNQTYIQAVVRDISERKELDESLTKNEALYRSLIDITDSVAWEVDIVTNEFTFISSSIEDISGFKSSDWKNFDFWKSRIHPEDREEAVRFCEDNTRDGKSHSFEYRMIKADGSFCWIRDEVSVKKVNGKVVTLRGYFIDITDQKKAALIKEEYTQKLQEKVDELYSSREEYKSLFNESLVSLWEADYTDAFHILNNLKAKGITDIKEYFNTHPNFIFDCLEGVKIIRANNASAQLFKAKTIDELLSRFDELVTVKNLDHFMGAFESVFNGETKFTLTTSFNDFNGEQMHGVVKYYFVKNEDELKANISIINVTQRVEAEQELFEQNQKLIDISNRLSNKNMLLEESRARFENLFEKSPVSLWEEDLTEVIALVNEKKKDTSNFKLFLDQNPEFVIECIEKVKIVNVNEESLILLGVNTKEELIESIGLSFNENSIAVFKNELLHLSKGEKKLLNETEFVKSNGEIVNAIVNLELINDTGSAIVSIVDVTAIKQAEINLRLAKEKAEESEKYFRAIFETNIDAISITRLSDGVFVEVSPSFLTYFGYEKQEVLGKTSVELGLWVDPQQRETILQELKKNGAVIDLDAKMKTKAGAVRLQLLSIKLFELEGVPHVLTVSHDVDIQKKAEAELILAKNKAEESDQLKSEFLNNISHEIRTPLNGIIGFSSFLSDKSLTEEMEQQYVSIIQNSGKQLIRIIDEILGISKLDSKEESLNIVKVCVNDLLFELGQIFKLIAKEKNLEFTVSYGLSNVESTILTDETKLNKILSNILQNAFKFTSRGGIKLGYVRQNGYLNFEVSDTGIGINEDKLERIFERFAQEDENIGTNFGGLGLGLSIVKEHVDLLGGQIAVSSEKGKGSTFKINIPYHAVAMKTEAKKTSEVTLSINENRTVLLVEDDEVNALLMKRLLQKTDLFKRVLHASNGQEAIEFCEKEKDINIVLMDIGIPIINGFDATKIIKKLRPDLPVIAQTAYSTEQDQQKIVEAGCDDFISKPIDYNVLIPLIEKHLN